MSETAIQKTWRLMAENTAKERAAAARKKPAPPAAPENSNAPLSVLAAKTLTKRIKDAGTLMLDLIVEAHDRKAWQAMGYNSWDEYTRGELDFTGRRGYQLIDHAKTLKDITPTEESEPGFTRSKLTEKHTRALKGLPPSKKRTAVKKATAEAGGETPTAAQVKDAVDSMKPANARDVTTAASLAIIDQQPEPEKPKCPHCGQPMP